MAGETLSMFTPLLDLILSSVMFTPFGRMVEPFGTIEHLVNLIDSLCHRILVFKFHLKLQPIF
jgi:hypothetical protein